MSTAAGHEAVELAAAVLGPLAVASAALGARTTYRVGGAAALLVEVRRPADLVAVAEARRVSGLPVLVVGRGSNLLVSDGGFPGIAVALAPAPEAYGAVAIDGVEVAAGGAVALPTLARRTVDVGLTGFEWAVGVPGSVGGAVRMNAGGHGSDMSATVAAATVVDLDGAGDGAGETWGPARLAQRYRASDVGAHHVVTGVVLRLGRGDREAGSAMIGSIVRWRREHQPGGRNAGSVFTNPTGGGPSAGALVERCGLKGHRHGSAEVSPKHANFIQADDGGSAEDVDALISEVAASVERATGVRLRSEIRRIGFDPPVRQSRPQVEGEGS